MNIADAAFHTVRDYPGGAVSLAPRLGRMPPKVLANKANPNCSTNDLSLDEASRLMALTGDYRILQALCMEHGFAAVQIIDGPIGDLSILDSIASAWKEFGDVGRTVQSVLLDGRVEKKEVCVLKDEIQDAIQSLLAIQHKIEELAE